MKEKLAVIILAAGKGERMKSSIPKVLHTVCERPMLGYVADLIKKIPRALTVAVLGYKQEEVRRFLAPGTKVVIQKKLRGTADAVRCAKQALKGFCGTLLVLYGDTPLLELETVRQLIQRHQESGAGCTLLTATAKEPAGYGRILRDRYNTVSGIVEDKDADDYQKSLKEINTGIVCFQKEALFRALGKVKADNAKKEYYLTDVISILYRRGEIIESFTAKKLPEAMGINSRVELALANKIMRQRINHGLMKQGVTIIDPDTTYIAYGVKIGQDSIIYPFTVIQRGVTIGKSCAVGPFTHLREGVCLADRVVAGNFLEIVRSRLGSDTWVKHFSYLGDSQIGSGVNIGAGTVIANFDGAKKHLTVIKDKAFIGSDTVLVAPVSIGKGAKTGAGSVVTSGHNVANHMVVAGVPACPLVHKIK